MNAAAPIAAPAKAKKSKQWLLNLIIVAIGLGILVVAGWQTAPTWDFFNSSIKVPGKMVTNEFDKSGSRKGYGYHAIFTFTDPSTQKIYRIRDDTKHNPALYDHGAALTVIYPPGQPEEARIDCFRSLWAVSAILGGGGLGIFLFGVIATLVDFLRR